MTQDDSAAEQGKQDGDSAASVSPDTQYADPTEAAPPEKPADREDDTFAAGTADTHDTGESGDDAPDAQGTSAESVSDGPDKESGFYG